MIRVSKGIVFVGLLTCSGLFTITVSVCGQDTDGDRPRRGSLPAHRPAVPGVHGLVSAGHPLAAMAGLRILMKGGNAVDAAVAVGATLNLVEPQMNGLGGNGFMTIFDKRTGRVYSLAMTGAAPKALKAEVMTPERLDWGIDAGIVPGNFGGYLTALERFGTMSLAEVLASAIDYAEHGYPIDPSLVMAIAGAKVKLEKFPSTATIFLPSGRLPIPGDLFRNPNLGATLRKAIEAEKTALKHQKSRSKAIEAAFDRFYTGDIARELDRFFKENHGLLTAGDLAAYRPTWAEPIHTTYRGYDVFSNPATSRGGLELAMELNLVEAYDLSSLGPGSPEALHYLIEAIKLAKADVYHYVGDPKFTQIPVGGLLSKSYAEGRRKLIDPHKAMSYPGWGEPGQFAASKNRFLSPPPFGPVFFDVYEAERDTTSFSIVDKYGNAVACTPTLGGVFGAGVVVGNTGLLLNNGIRLGSTSPYPESVNYVHGGRIPLLNNAPTIVLKGGKLAMVFGTPGGETIGQTEFQMLVNVLDFQMPVQQAIEAPRFILDAKPNFYKPGAEILVAIEHRTPAVSLQTLEQWGHHVNVISDFTAAVGGMQAIVLDIERGTMLAGADPRRTGYAVGW